MSTETLDLQEYQFVMMFRCLKQVRYNFRCPYCQSEVPIHTDIFGAYGVRWGHRTCIVKAFQEGMLLPSKANADLRPVQLEPRLRTPEKVKAQAVHKQIIAPAWSDQALGAPTCSCPYFQPKLIRVVFLPEELQIRKTVADEMETEALSAAEDAIWEKYLKEWLGSYKRTTRHLPNCPAHQWSTDTKDHLQIKVAYVNGNRYTPQRALWWYCPVEVTP